MAGLITYTSRTGTRRNVAALAARNWGWLIGPEDQGGRILAGMRHAIDNGAWPAFQRKRPWDARRFRACYLRHGPGADFVVAPDIVAGGAQSLALTRQWLPELLAAPELAGARVLIAVQDGMTEAEVAPLLGGRVGLFLGGSTEWKLATMAQWGRAAARKAVWYHVARVNTARRTHMAIAAGAWSIDGTSGAMFAETIPMLDGAARQSDMFSPRPRP